MVHPSLDELTLDTMSNLISASLRRSKKRNIKDAGYVANILELFVHHNLHQKDVLVELAEYLRARIKGMISESYTSC